MAHYVQLCRLEAQPPWLGVGIGGRVRGRGRGRGRARVDPNPDPNPNPNPNPSPDPNAPRRSIRARVGTSVSSEVMMIRGSRGELGSLLLVRG